MLHDWICEITLLFKQILLIVKTNASLFSHALMLLAPMRGKRGVLTIIYIVVGAICLPSFLSTNNHNFFVLKMNISLCFQMLN